MKIWVLEKTGKDAAVRLFATNVPAARVLSKALGRAVDLDKELLEEIGDSTYSLYERNVETT